MKKISSQRYKFLGVGFAALLMFWASSQRPYASTTQDNSASLYPVHAQNLIHFKRGALDTAARVDLDTSEEDLEGVAGMNALSTKRTRIVQFAGSVRPAWIKSLQAA